MSTYTQILYQIVFGTKDNEQTMVDSGQKTLYKYIWGILKNKKCHLYRINGMEDHIHIVTHIHPTVALSSLIKDIKIALSEYIKMENLFPNFKGWQNGYGASTYSITAKYNLIEYVKNQKKTPSKTDLQERIY